MATVKEFYIDHETGLVEIEYDDSSIVKYSMNEVVTKPSTLKTVLGSNSKISKPKVAFVGDSITEYGGNKQMIIITTDLFPFGGSAFSIISVSWDNVSGTTGTLTFSKTNKTLKWAASGESAGPEVNVSKAGVYTIPSSTSSKTITIVCRPRYYASATEGNHSVTTTAATESSRRSSRTFAWWALAKCKNAFEPFLLSNGGSIISDITESMSWQVQDSYYDAIVLECGTNDLSLDRSLAQMQADMLAQIKVATSKSPRVFVLTILPRSANITASRRQNLIDFNKWLLNLNIYGVSAVNTFFRIADPDSVNADPITGALDDGLHPGPYGSEAIGDAVANALNDYFQFDAATVISAQTDIYNASTNISGNALPSGGTFTGTAGTFGTGCSGTLASNWNLSRDTGSTITAVASKVQRSDGLPGNLQRIVISNSGAGSERVTLTMVSGARPAISAGQVWRLQGSVTPSSMIGVEQISLGFELAGTSGAFNSIWGHSSVSGSVLTGSRSKLVMEPWPLTLVPSATAMNIALKVQLAPGGSCTIDLHPGEWRLFREI